MSLDASQQPTRQFREPRVYTDDVNSLWAAIQANQRDIAEAKLSTTQALGVMSTQLATIQTTVINLQKLLEQKQDRDEDNTYRAWQNERYHQQRAYPQEQMAQRNSNSMLDQTRAFQLQALMMVLTPFLSILLVKLFG